MSMYETRDDYTLEEIIAFEKYIDENINVGYERNESASGEPDEYYLVVVELEGDEEDMLREYENTHAKVYESTLFVHEIIVKGIRHEFVSDRLYSRGVMRGMVGKSFVAPEDVDEFHGKGLEDEYLFLDNHCHISYHEAVKMLWVITTNQIDNGDCHTAIYCDYLAADAVNKMEKDLGPKYVNSLHPTVLGTATPDTEIGKVVRCYR